jgi:hypothetical protein
MYVSAKMIPVETVPGVRRGGMKERSGRVNSSMMYLIHCKNLCKCYNVPPPTTMIKKKKDTQKRFSCDSTVGKHTHLNKSSVQPCSGPLFAPFFPYASYNFSLKTHSSSMS